MLKVLSISLLVSLLIGCVTTDNPREGGFLGGVSGVLSGDYENRVSMRRAKADTAKQRQQSLLDENNNLLNSRDDAASQLKVVESQIADTYRNIYKIRKQISLGIISNDELKSKVNLYDRELSDLRTEINSLSTVNNSSTTRALRAKKEQLEREYIALLELLNAQL